MIKQGIAGILALGGVGSGMYVVEDRYANEEPTSVKIAAVEDRLEEKIISDDLYLTQQQEWRYEDRLKEDPDNQMLQEMQRELRYRKEELREALDSLRMKRIGN